MTKFPGIFTQQSISAASTEYSLWYPTASGTFYSDADRQVLGTKFQTSVSGNVVGIRWQRQSGWPGSAEVALFNLAGTNLSGTRTVTGQAASGWCRMDFASPVAISSSTIYIAAVRTTSGDYYATNSYFASSSFTNGPITAVSNSTSINGVFLDSATMASPTSSWQSSSYFIDVVFAA